MEKTMLSIGCDEAGRGAWAGPIIAAAVLAKESDLGLEIKDSKVLPEKLREGLAKYLIENFPYGLGLVSAQMIDTFGISYANTLAFERALRHLRNKCLIAPNTQIRIDGRKLPIHPVWCKNITFLEKGESQYKTIAAASIIAKTYRDSLLRERDRKEPDWQWAKHKGYGTAIHHAKLKLDGPILGFHRISYRPVAKCLEV